MTQHFDEKTKSQLRALREIVTISEAIEIKFWLRGGWAIDFLLGKITRAHDDIDLITWIKNRERLENELKKYGYEVMPVKAEFRDRQADFRKGSVEITFCYISYSADGNLIMNGLPEWIWRKDSLLPQIFMLNGISAHVLHPRQLLEEKEAYEEAGRIPRQKDVESKRVLHHIIKGFA